MLSNLRRLDVILRWALEEVPPPTGLAPPSGLERIRWLGRQSLQAQEILARSAPFAAAGWSYLIHRCSLQGLRSRLAARMQLQGEELARASLAMMEPHRHVASGAAFIRRAEQLAAEARDLGAPSADEATRLCAAWRKAQRQHAKAIDKAQEYLAALQYRAAADAFLRAHTALQSPLTRVGMQIAREGMAIEADHDNELSDVRLAVREQSWAEAHARLSRIWARFPREDVRRLLARVSDSLEARGSIRAGFVSAVAGEYGKAERCFAQAAERMGEQVEGAPRMALWLAGAAVARGAPERAVDHLAEPADREEQRLRGLVLAACSRWLEALQCFENAGAEHEAVIARQRLLLRRRACLERVVALLDREAFSEAERFLVGETGQDADPMLLAVLERSVRPQVEQARWRAMGPRERLMAAGRDLMREPDAGKLHLWFVALDSLVDEDTALVPDWMAAVAAVAANMQHSPRLGALEGQLPESRRNLIREMLLARVERRLDLAREQTPDLERAWRDCWRVERAALDAREKRHSLPRAGDLHLTPGLWNRLDARPAAPGLATVGTFLARCLPVLYTALDKVAAAMVAKDPERAADLYGPVSGPENDVVLFGKALGEFAVGSRVVAGGDARGWEVVASGKAAMESSRYLRDRLDDAAFAVTRAWEESDEDAPDQGELGRRAVFVSGWRTQLDSARARTAHVDVEVALLIPRLNGNSVGRKEAIKHLEGLLAIVPGHVGAGQLLLNVKRIEVAGELDAALKRGQFDRAVNLAVEAGHDDLRLMLANEFRKILVSGLGRMESGEATRLMRWIARLDPSDKEIRDFARANGISL